MKTVAPSTARALPRAYSTRELAAAAAALAAGRFAAAHTTTDRAAATSDDESAHTDTFGARSPRRGEAPGSTAVAAPAAGTLGTAGLAGMAPVVRVRAANAGAGASTVVLALADVADAAGVRTRVLDAAAPAWSGLAAATETELGAVGGWRRGRRGERVVIDRVEEPVVTPTEVPAPRLADGIDLTVLDAGWSLRELANTHRGWLVTTSAHVEVLVTRSHRLALSQTEAALEDLDAQLLERIDGHVDEHTGGRLGRRSAVIVVVIGAARWSDRDFIAAGPRLRRTHDRGAVVFSPLVSTKTLAGLGPVPLPKQLNSSAQRLLERITTITGPLSKGPHRDKDSRT